MARILVVDDDPDILRVADKILSSNDHVVFTAKNAMKAMDLMNSMTFDCLISDINMPQFSGFDLIQTLTNNKRFQNMAVAMLTGMRGRKEIERAIRAGVDDYIVKPIDPVIFLGKIEALFLKKPPMKPLEIKLQQASSSTDAQCSFNMKILSLSEFGLVIKSPIELHSGMPLDLTSEFFRKIEVPVPLLKVVSSKRIQEFHYETRVVFVGAKPKVLERIRKWIESQSSLGKVA